MSFRWYLFLVLLATVLSAAAFGYVVTIINPSETDTTGFAFFYTSLFLVASGLFVLLALCLGYLFLRDGNAVLHYAGRIFRQAFLFALTVIGILLLLATHYFVWWSALLIVLFFGGLETLILTSKRQSHEEYV